MTGGKEISSNKGTTQGGPVAIGMYVLGLIPLLTSIINNNKGNLIHLTFAYDLTGAGKIHELIEWWKKVLHCGPYLGYYVKKNQNMVKIMKEEYIEIDMKYPKTIK